MDLDITIVAGRRPELLQRTLESFSQNAFKFHNVVNVYANIDPIFGTEDDEARCIALLHQNFASPVIYTPEAAGFGAAVKRLWQGTTADYVFHLEDDWIALDALDERVAANFRDTVKQVSFHSASQNWDIRKRGHLHRGKRYWKFAGIRVPRSSFTKFTTSPSVIDGTVARRSAELMNPAFDPEKQFYSNVNKSLETYIASFDNYIFSPAGIPVVEDTGRDWRDQRGIQKKIINAASSWVSE
ncbi:glycosyltransferase family 2 protein [Agrobacterium rosae]